MGRPTTLEGFKIDMGHQEMDRLVTELEEMWKSVTSTDEGEVCRGR
jgi:hypothetical protein